MVRMLQKRAHATPVPSRAAIASALGVLIAAASCSGSGTSGEADLGAPDLRVPDLATPDLKPAVPPDLAVVPDMSPPMLTGLPTDCTPGTTLDVLYTTVVKPRCAVESCHGNPYSQWGALTAGQFRSVMVDQRDTQTPNLVRVKASDLNGSYLMYKLTNQQTKVAPAFRAGVQMPNGQTPLDHDSLCRFISWIQAGAN
jgi:hypothetical protein